MTDRPPDPKTIALRRVRALNRLPETVSAPEFRDDGEMFFDPRDIVQVKYEMLRRVLHDGSKVSHVAAAFGFSRPAFYEAKEAFEKSGIAGLMPALPGPRQGHKLSPAVLAALEEALAGQPSLNSAHLAHLVEERFGLRVHRRSVERALARRRSTDRAPTPSG